MNRNIYSGVIYLEIIAVPLKMNVMIKGDTNLCKIFITLDIITGIIISHVMRFILKLIFTKYREEVHTADKITLQHLGEKLQLPLKT